jgi:hypothetical protein
MSVNKHLAIKTWVEQFLDGNKMYFDNIEAYQGARSLVPDYGDFIIRTDITGRKTKWYSFGFIAIEPLDRNDSDINNATTRQLVDDFNDWLVEQQELKNFPDFGENVIKYKIEPLYNTANLAQAFEDNGMAKYVLMARIEYVEQ